jgi:competence protein ComEA
MADGSRGTALVWVLAAALAALALIRITGSGGDDAPASPVRVERSPGAAAPATARGGRGGIYVHVAGAVRRPGLVRVPSGSRVAVALERVGGPARKADLAGVNLAARLEDGQQVVVPVRGAAPASGAAGAGPGVAAPGSRVAGTPKLSLASATAEQLDQIDGIGPTLAQRILEYRTENGGFGSVEELREVEGIGEKRFGTLRDAVQP